MSYEVKVLADSIAPSGARLVTYQLKYARLIHQELLTHRSFSRNASSSRAIPINRMIEWVQNDPATPIHFGSAKKGMQAGEEITEKQAAKEIWLAALRSALEHARSLNQLSLHKQIVNRILEPWSHINVVLSATEFQNFFALRCHKDAQPEIQKLAVMMARAYRDSTPTMLEAGQWHLPYIHDEEKKQFDLDSLRKISVARCCRVSYLTVDGKPSSPEKDIQLHDQLIQDGHWSPTEHVAMATDEKIWSGNFFGFVQYRKTLPVDHHQSFDFSTLDSFDNDYKIS